MMALLAMVLLEPELERGFLQVEVKQGLLARAEAEALPVQAEVLRLLDWD